MKRIATLIIIGFGYPLAVFAQGSLTPPGAPAPTMKTLQQVEPRTPISSLPYTITNSGSYYLTATLTGVTLQVGITVQADDVTIDLNGFGIVGVPLSSSGIDACCSQRRNLCVRNGTIRNWGGDGINAATVTDGQFENLRLFSNLSGGMEAGTNCLVRVCNVELNASGGGYGIAGYTGCRIIDCTAKSNNGDGIKSLNAGVSVSGCTSQLNTGNGISVGANGIIKNCVAIGNGGAGFSAGGGSTVTGCSSGNNSAHGILAGPNCTIDSCTAQTNNSVGIQTDTSCVVSRCVAVRNLDRGIYVGDNSLVSGCASQTNSTIGIRGSDNCTIKDCVVLGNSSYGIQVINYGLISGCMVARNGGSAPAIDINTGTSVVDCNVVQNGNVGINTQNRCVVRGCHINNNFFDGIRITADCVVVDNDSGLNNPSSTSVDGIYITGDSNHIEGNVLHGNGGYGLHLSGSQFNVITRNNAKGNITGSYSLSGVNDVGPLGTAATSTSPWANIQ